MPWESDQQRKWGNSPTGLKALGRVKVNEYNQATRGRDLPERAKSMTRSDKLAEAAKKYLGKKGKKKDKLAETAQKYVQQMKAKK